MLPADPSERDFQPGEEGLLFEAMIEYKKLVDREAREDAREARQRALEKLMTKLRSITLDFRQPARKIT